ncbi:MAG: 3-deoxy-D-manno-octulosonic acid transferase [Tranquillimonas sp.]
MLLRAYLAFARVGLPLWRRALAARVRRGKEDPARLPERLGTPSLARPDGPLLWFHALSVGESLALVTLLRRLGAARPDAHFLLTTTTRASVEALAKVGLPPRVLHQYLPVDAAGPVDRFLDHWRPDLVAFAELDLWPYMLTRIARRGIPLVVVNARVTDRSLGKWRRSGGAIRALLALPERILSQDDLSTERFRALGAPADRVETLGPLKGAADPLPDLPPARAEVEAWLGARPVWLAAPTDRREEAQLLAAHARARSDIADLLMILAPRQPRLADETEAEARQRFAGIARRSRAEVPAPDCAIYIADTIGEMGLWYRVAPVALIGHSMPVAPPLTGKNPYEALALDCLVLHGPDVANFRDIYAQLDAAGATRQVEDADDLGRTLTALLADPAARAAQTEAARQALRQAALPLERTTDLLARMLAGQS